MLQNFFIKTISCLLLLNLVKIPADIDSNQFSFTASWKLFCISPHPYWPPFREHSHIMRGFKLNHTLIIKIIGSLNLRAQKIKLNSHRIMRFRYCLIWCFTQCILHSEQRLRTKRTRWLWWKNSTIQPPIRDVKQPLWYNIIASSLCLWTSNPEIV